MAGTARDDTHRTTRAEMPDKDEGKDRERRRLAEALRANLERRKKQKRARQSDEADAGDR